MPLLVDVNLPELDAVGTALDRDARRSELDETDQLSACFSKPERISRVGELIRPCLGRELCEKGCQVLGFVEVRESVGEAGAEQRIDGGEIGRCCGR